MIYIYIYIYYLLPFFKGGKQRSKWKKISNRETGKCVISTKSKKMEQFPLSFHVFEFISTK